MHSSPWSVSATSTTSSMRSQAAGAKRALPSANLADPLTSLTARLHTHRMANGSASRNSTSP
eukprot:5801967-Prymnesium_polylepis.1